jgi:hypothetical protein
MTPDELRELAEVKAELAEVKAELFQWHARFGKITPHDHLVEVNRMRAELAELSAQSQDNIGEQAMNVSYKNHTMTIEMMNGSTLILDFPDSEKARSVMSHCLSAIDGKASVFKVNGLQHSTFLRGDQIQSVRCSPPLEPPW